VLSCVALNTRPNRVPGLCTHTIVRQKRIVHASVACSGKPEPATSSGNLAQPSCQACDTVSSAPVAFFLPSQSWLVVGTHQVCWERVHPDAQPLWLPTQPLHQAG
jgi:hypothetical protein